MIPLPCAGEGAWPGSVERREDGGAKGRAGRCARAARKLQPFMSRRTLVCRLSRALRNRGARRLSDLVAVLVLFGRSAARACRPAPTRSTTRWRNSSPTSFRKPRRRSRARGRSAAAGRGDPGGARRQSPCSTTADHVIAYKTTAGALVNAKTGEPATADAFKKVRVNNAIRSAIEGSIGSLTLANPDPEKRSPRPRTSSSPATPRRCRRSRPQLAKESDPRVADALRLAEAAIVASSDDVSSTDRLAAIEPEGARRPGRAEPASTRCCRRRPTR